MDKNSSTYNFAKTILMERFPSIGLMIPNTPCRKIPDEPPPSFDLENTEALYVYGLGNGAVYFKCSEWLGQSSERKLIFLEDDPEAISSFLDRKEAIEVLSHPQIYLELFSHEEKQIEELARKFPFKRIEFAALKSKKRSSKLKISLLRKTALSHALYVDRLYGNEPFKNFIENSRHLSHSFYANGLKGAFEGVPAVVCGAGPSLESSIDALSLLENRALLIAGGSTVAALSGRGIRPHFGMAVDPNLEEYRRFKNSFAFETPLLYSTRVHPSIFQTCNGPFGYMRTGIGGAVELWIEEELALSDPLIGEELSAETISVTAICIAWAQFLGCNPILLNGIDLAYTGNKRYVSGVADEKEIFREGDRKEKSAADRLLRRKDRFGKSVLTAVRWLIEAASISDFAKNHPSVRWINTTEGGIGIEGVPYLPLKEALSLFPEKNIRQEVYKKIRENPMPSGTEATVKEQIGKLQSSLDRLIDHLRVLSGKKRGSKPLAEIELEEEIAYLFLFYDIWEVLKKGDSFWEEWLLLALKYREAMGSVNSPN